MNSKQRNTKLDLIPDRKVSGKNFQVQFLKHNHILKIWQQICCFMFKSKISVLMNMFLLRRRQDFD